MKEFNIPAPIRPSEANREAFVKVFGINETWEQEGWPNIKSILPHLEILERKGLVAETVAIREDEAEGKIYLYMERINGFELSSFSEQYEDYTFSIDLAKKAARLFQGFFDSGYFYADPGSANIMYDQVKGKCVVVDVAPDAIILNQDNRFPLKEYVRAYSELMLDTYLSRIVDRDEEAELTAKRLKSKGVQPVMIGFILRGLSPVTCPENFDEILQLKSEVDGD